MKIGEIISTYRTKVRARNQVCDLNDYELYLLINSIANSIKSKILRKGDKLGYKNYLTISLDLESAIFKSECQPTFLGCKVQRTTVQIPNALKNIKGYELQVYSGKTQYNLMDFNKGFLIDHPMLKNYYDIIDGYLYIFKSKTIDCITLKGAWEDVTVLEDIKDSSNKYCYNPQEHEFPLDDAYISILYIELDKSLDLYIKTNENVS